MFRSLKEINEAAIQRQAVKIAVAAAADLDVLTAVNDAKMAGIADAILVGDVAETKALCQQHGIDTALFEFENEPEDSVSFAEALDTAMRKQNMYYDDLIVGKVLRKVVVTKVAKNGFQDYMKSIGKLGGQNKIPRLSNDRKIVVLLKNE